MRIDDMTTEQQVGAIRKLIKERHPDAMNISVEVEGKPKLLPLLFRLGYSALCMLAGSVGIYFAFYALHATMPNVPEIKPQYAIMFFVAMSTVVTNLRDIMRGIGGGR